MAKESTPHEPQVPESELESTVDTPTSEETAAETPSHEEEIQALKDQNLRLYAV